MKQKILSAFLAGAVALSPIASAPAFAGGRSHAQKQHNNDLEKFLLGATALIIVGKAISDQRSRKRAAHPAPQPQHRPAPAPHVSHKPAPAPSHAHRDTPRNAHRDAPRHTQRHTPRRMKRALPANCVRMARTHHGRQQIAVNRCLRGNDVHLSRLPQRCATQYSHGARIKNGFSAGCLRQNGYRFY